MWLIYIKCMEYIYWLYELKQSDKLVMFLIPESKKYAQLQ